jgi:hypothetical protein
MFKILIISIITFIIVIIIFLLFISFSNIDINTNSKINENFFVSEPSFDGGIKENYYGNLFIKYTINGTITFNNDTLCKVLIVGGGGGGGRNNDWEGGGGGGGGGVGMGIIKFNRGINYTINIGSGGYGGFGNINGNNGNNTSITGGSINEIAYGGGGGGWRQANDGGSGGGGGGHAGDFSGGSSTKGKGTFTYYGNNGGNGYNQSGGSGGGGAGSAGQTTGKRGNYNGGDGGSGILCDIDNNYYGGGGGGASGCHGSCYVNTSLSKGRGIGGRGGGGNGGHRNDPTSGTNNTGGGGGGSSLNNAGNGGSGIVLINYNFNFKTPWGLYIADNWSNDILKDSSGNERHATTSGTITRTTGSGNGATGDITYISGNTQSKINWPTGSIPSNFTILSLTRYNGGSRGRILQSSSGNWLHGHWSDRRGVCYYEGWRTNYDNKGINNNWLCCISKNSGSTPNNILLDGIPYGTNTGGAGGGSFKLCINDQYNENSDWALSCVIIWDQHLTNNGMYFLNNYINNYMNTGDLTDLIKSIPLSSSASTDSTAIYIDPSLDNTVIQKDSDVFTTNFYKFSPYRCEYNSGITNSNISSINRSSTNTQNILTFNEDRFKIDGFFKDSSGGEFITIKFKNNFCLKKIIFVAKSNSDNIYNAPSAWEIYAGTDKTSGGGISTSIIFRNIETGSTNSTNDYLKTTDLKSTNNYIILLTNNNIEANVYKIVFTKTFGGTKLDFDQLILESGKEQMTITSTSS